MGSAPHDIGKALRMLKDAAVAAATVPEKAKLLEAYNRALESNARVRELETENAELRQRLAFKETLRFERNVLWSEGDPNPYCNACWEGSQKPIHLSRSYSDSTFFRCPQCGKSYDTVPGNRPRLSGGEELPPEQDPRKWQF